MRFDAFVRKAFGVAEALLHIHFYAAAVGSQEDAGKFHLGGPRVAPESLFVLRDGIAAAAPALHGIGGVGRGIGFKVAVFPGGAPFLNKVGDAGLNCFQIFGGHAHILFNPFHAHNAEIAVRVFLPIQAADAFGGHVGCAVILAEPGHPVARPGQGLHIADNGVQPRKQLEQALFIGPEASKGFIGYGVEFGIIKSEHVFGAAGPGRGPGAGFIDQGGADLLVFRGFGPYFQGMADRHGQAGHKFIAYVQKIRQIEGDAAFGLLGDNFMPFGVDPDAVA